MSEEKKISLDELEDLLEEGESSRSRFNFATIFAMLVLNWQYFLFSLIIFLCGAFLYLRYTEPTYKISARLLIKEDQNRSRRNASQMLSNMADMGFMTNSSGIDNEVEVLQSRVLLRDVVKDLKLYAEYYREGRVRDALVYGKQPVRVEMDPVHLDSLDKSYIEGGAVSTVKMKVVRKSDSYLVEGTVNQGPNHVTTFTKKVRALPLSQQTPIGTLTMTQVPQYDFKSGDVYYVTIRPPMVVATNYLNAMTVESTSKLTDIAMVTLTDKHIQRGMDFLRCLEKCYNRQANTDKNEIALRTEEFINDRLAKIDAELGSTEGKIEQYKRSQAMTGLPVDVSQAVQMSSQFSTRLSEANAQIRLIDFLREYVNNPQNKNQLIPSNVGLTDGTTTQLIASYNKAVQDRNRLLTAASEQSPQVLTLTETIESLESSIKTALQQARRSAEINRQGILSEYGKYQGRISSAPVQERVLTEIGRQQDVKSGIYLLLLQKREENSIEQAATADKGKLIDEPLYEGKVKPKKMMVIIGAIALAFALPLLIIWLINLFRYKIEGHEDVARLTDLPVIADVAVASESVKTSAGIVVHENKNTQMDEIFRSLRTNIQFMLKENEKVILFTSSTSGEGKTFCAANLATSFALLGKKVILCGLDIRKPALGRLFGIHDTSLGISLLLTKEQVTEEDLQRQIVKSGTNDNLDLLLAGPVPPNPTELLARDNFKQIVDMLQQQYDYVIFDTAPVGLVTDTLQIAAHAHVSVLICRADYTPKSSFGLLNNLSKEGKLPNACVVLNGIDMSRRKYGYYYGYGNYGKYGRYGYGRYGYGRYGYGNYGSYGQYGRYAQSHYGQENDDSVKQ
ncbi:MAG: polysaccharide biosynthesis tyrosine autokinase [Prevotella sp.]|nr:polysaccharide biosynthesis tyrosine autokinase [Prevotella sp.]